jgi:hypothetical protein
MCDYKWGSASLSLQKIIEKPAKAQALIGFPQRPQNFVPAG